MSDHAPLIERAFELDVSERGYEVSRIEGHVPDWVRGTFYSNGPGRYSRGGVRYRHLLDGDGMLRCLRFTDAGVRFANRFVRSRKQVEEESAGRALFRTFGTRFAGDLLNRYGAGIESPVNVSAWRFAGRLLAFGEQGLPWEIDPLTLETRGLHTFGGALNEVSPFSAHPKIDADTGEMFNFGISFSAERPTLNLYRFDPAGALVYRRRLEIPDPCSVHDFALSPSYAVVYLNSHVLDIGDLREGGLTVMESLRWEPERGSSLLVASRDDGRALARVRIEGAYCLHTVGAFEENGQLVCDVVEMEEPVYPDYQVIPDLFDSVRPARVVRYRLDTQDWCVVERVVVPSALSHDFPIVDPRLQQAPNAHTWMLSISATGRPGRKFFDQLTHVDIGAGGVEDFYALPQKQYFGCEPMFLPDPSDPGAGLILCKRFDAEALRDAYLLFDAYDVAAGPVATLHLEEATPPCFHGSYYPDAPTS